MTKFSDIWRDITSSEGDAVGSLQIILLAKERLPTDITFSQEEAASRYYLYPQRLYTDVTSIQGRLPRNITSSLGEEAYRYFFQPYFQPQRDCLQILLPATKAAYIC